MFYYILLILFLVISFISRISLAIYSYYNNQIAFKIEKLLEVFTKGIIVDLITFLYIFVPIYALLLILPKKLRNSKLSFYLNHLLYFIYIFILCFMTAAEITFRDEFGSRFNFIAVDYLIYTNEVIGNIVESYPLFTIFSCITIISVGFPWIFTKFFKLNFHRLDIYS